MGLKLCITVLFGQFLCRKMRGLWRTLLVLGALVSFVEHCNSYEFDEDPDNDAEDEGDLEEPDFDPSQDYDEIGFPEEIERTWEPLTSNQIRGVHKNIDKNNDGLVSLAEVMFFSSQMKDVIAAKEIQKVMAEMDQNRDKKLSLEEILQTFKPQDDDDDAKAAFAAETEMQTAKFKLADADGNGLLESHEVHPLFYPDSHDGILDYVTASAFRERDWNGDGELSKVEFWEGGQDPAKAIEYMRLTPDEEAMYLKLDKNKDDLISLSELRDWESGKIQTEQAMLKLMEICDTNNDRHMSLQELDEARKRITEHEAQQHLWEWAKHSVDGVSQESPSVKRESRSVQQEM